jgi:hypothetical protein
MAKSMIRRRQEAERLSIEAYETTLRRVHRAARPAPDFERALAEVGEGIAGPPVREGALWRPQLKTRNAARLRLAAARYLYAHYPVPLHLERIWLDSNGLPAAEILLRKRWYVAAARGASLYKAEASAWLSRKEVHAFLNLGGDLSFEEAFCFAIALSYTEEAGIAARIARTKIALAPREEIAFWREVMRFFCDQPATGEEIDDLCDFLSAARRRDAGYSLKGRTLASLRRAMQEWHRDIAAIERIEAMRRRAMNRPGARQAPEGGRWDGSPLSDWQWEPSAKEAVVKGERFVLRQLTSAEDLVYESRAMHHCVSSYAAKCIAGQASIWVLRRVTHNRIDRLLTIEVNPQNRVIQVRGFGNRLAQPGERAILERWAKARGLVLAS